jgi:peroxiredoxin
MSSRRPHVVWLLGALLLLGADTAPLELEGEDGAPLQLSLQPGEAAVVAHFWATWCRSCTEELPALAEAAVACEGAPVRVVTVNVGEDAETIARYKREHAFELPVLRDPKGRVWRGFARGLPVNVFWTESGRRTDFGPRDGATWRREFAALGCADTAPPAPPGPPE